MHARKSNVKLRMVVFDMDGVLVDFKSSWQFIHAAFEASNMENVKRYVEGKITYGELMRRDIALWGRAHIDKIKSILSEAPLMPGATEAVTCLKMARLKTALISAGVSVLADRLRTTLGLDHVFANKILTDRQGFLTGEGEETVSLLDKLKVLNKLVVTEDISLKECAVVGDSSYDIPMFKEVGLSIAFNTNENNVKKAADVVVEKKDLREILPYLVERSERCRARTIQSLQKRATHCTSQGILANKFQRVNRCSHGNLRPWHIICSERKRR
jgi:phosphoserine phosphatase